MWPFTKRKRENTAPADPQEQFDRPAPPAPAPAQKFTPAPAPPMPARPRAESTSLEFTPAPPIPARHPAMPSAATFAGLLLPTPRPADLDELDQGVHEILGDLVGPTGRYRLVPRTPGDDDGDDIFTRLIVDHTVAHISAHISDTLDAQQRQVEPPTAPVIAIDLARSRRA